MSPARLQLDAVDDATHDLGALLDLVEFLLGELHADDVRDAPLADDTRYTQEHLLGDAVPTFR